MQWILLVLWLAMALWGPVRLVRPCMAAGLIASMLLQLALLSADGMLRLETALPLHLCGLFGVLSIFLVYRAPAPLWEAAVFLAAPAAGCTLFFPAIIACSHPGLMMAAFSQLHVLIALVPVFLFRTGKPLPMNPRRTLILGSGYLGFVGAFNRAFGTNYLFLRSAPAGTPLEWFFCRGTAFYVCSLLMLCMPLFTLIRSLCCQLNARRFSITAGNSSAYSR